MTMIEQRDNILMKTVTKERLKEAIQKYYKNINMDVWFTGPDVTSLEELRPDQRLCIAAIVCLLAEIPIVDGWPFVNGHMIHFENASNLALGDIDFHKLYYPRLWDLSLRSEYENVYSYTNVEEGLADAICAAIDYYWTSE